MSETLLWWLMVQFIGLAALPLCLAFFRRLPDRGYAFSKPFGLIIGGYLFWILNTVRVLPNTQRGIAWALLLLAAGSALLAWSRREELLAFVWRHWRVIVLTEVLFTVAFVVAAYLRSFVPEISATEKPMDLMFVNAATLSERFPPHDPWLSGFSVSYYYFGYLLVAMVGKLAAVQTAIGYNLGLAMIAALAVTAAFGVVYNLVAARQGDAEEGESEGVGLLGRPVLFGLGAALLVGLMGNLEGVLEFLAAHRVGWSGFWDWVNIEGLNASQGSDAWYPSEGWQYWWWFRATRMDPAGAIEEFPFFSFLLGDLHPHVMSIPFVLLAVGAALALFRSEEPLDLVYWLRRPLALAALAILLGGLAFLNTWDMPTLGFVVIAVALARNFLLAGRWRWDVVVDTLGFVVPVLVAAALAYSPFFLGGFDSQARGFAVGEGDGSRLFHTLLFWGPFAVIIIPYALWRLRREGRWEVSRRSVMWSLAPGVAIVLVWLAWDALAAIAGWGPFGAITDRAAIIQLNDPGSWGERIAERGANWLTAVIFIGTLAVLLLALWRELRSSAALSERRGAIFALILAATAVLLVLGAEFFFIMDVFASRMNTVFKLYYQAWLLLGLACGFALYELFSAWRPRFENVSLLRHAWAALVGLVLAGALLYPLGAILSRTDAFGGQRSLDGLAFVREGDPDEYAAIQWLAEHGDSDTVVVEAVGQSYETRSSRVSGRTGMPTILGWPGHELQWRGTSEPFAGREEDVARIYGSTDPEETMRLLEKYDATFVFVGSWEREQYPDQSLQKFEEMFEVAFQQGDVTIYRVGLSRLRGEELRSVP